MLQKSKITLAVSFVSLLLSSLIRLGRQEEDLILINLCGGHSFKKNKISILQYESEEQRDSCKRFERGHTAAW